MPRCYLKFEVRPSLHADQLSVQRDPADVGALAWIHDLWLLLAPKR